MAKIRTLLYMIEKNPKAIKKSLMENFTRSTIAKLVPDRMMLKMQYRTYIGKTLNISNPQSFNEKLQWLKLYDRNPEYVKLVDKYEVKRIIAERVGKEYLIPTLAIWDSVEDIDLSSLPNKFVLKCTHDSGSTIICKDKTKFDYNQAKKELSQKLKRNMFWWGREWPYKSVKRRIIAEKFMVDESGYELKDYKFFCFNGKVRALFIASDRPHDTRFDFFDTNFNHLPFVNGHPNANKLLTRPSNFNEMIVLAEKLSEGIPHVRVDLYSINDSIYFGEYTFFHYSGMVPFEPEEWDYLFGEWLQT